MTTQTKIIFYLLFIFITCTSTQSFGQADFRPGYYINSKNDTIYGLINYSNNKTNTQVCNFKKDINSNNQSFGPHEILAYRFIDGQFYISKSINSENKQVLIFLENLIDGTVDLYYYFDDFGEHYLIDAGDNQLHELTGGEKEIYENDQRYVKESKKYIGILKYTFRKSPTITKKVDEISLNHKSLIKIAHDYHNEVCYNEECIVYEQKVLRKPTRFGLLLGINSQLISLVNNIPDKYYYLRNAKFEEIIYPSIGFYYKIYIPSVKKRFLLQYEGTLSFTELRATNSYMTDSNMKLTCDLTLETSTFNNLIELRYELENDKVWPTFQTGAFINYSFGTNYINKLEQQTSAGNTFFSVEYRDNPFSEIDYGLSFGFGIKIKTNKKKEIFLDLKYQKGFGMEEFFRTNYVMANMGIQI